jgi:hypothetical protein
MAKNSRKIFYNCAYSRKCNADLRCEKIYIPYPQAVDISGLELWKWKDIFVNPLNILLIRHTRL